MIDSRDVQCMIVALQTLAISLPDDTLNLNCGRRAVAREAAAMLQALLAERNAP